MVRGGAQAVTEDGVIVLTYDKGSLFGERAIIERKLRAIDIVTTEQTFVLKVDPDSFLQILNKLNNIASMKDNYIRNDFVEFHDIVDGTTYIKEQIKEYKPKKKFNLNLLKSENSKNSRILVRNKVQG